MSSSNLLLSLSPSSSARKPVKKLTKVALITEGTRGDVQPYLALVMALQKAGFDVKLFTNSNHMAFANNLGIMASGCFPDSEMSLQSPEGIEVMSGGNVRGLLKFMGNNRKKSAKDSVVAFSRALRKFAPDLVIEGTLVWYWAAICTYRWGIPSIKIKLQYMPANPKTMVLGLPDLPFGLNSFLVK